MPFLTDKDARTLCEHFPDDYHGLDFLDDETTLIFDTLKTVEPDFLPLIARLSITGSEGARERVMRSLNGIVMMIRGGSRNKVALTPQKIEKDIREIAKIWQGELSPLIQFTWNFLNVAHEAGITDPALINAHEQRLLHVVGETPVPADWYWRGLSALALATPPVNRLGANEDFTGYPDFVEWAGKHADIRTVIRFATERSTKDVAVLTELMNRQALTPALGQGVL